MQKAPIMNPVQTSLPSSAILAGAVRATILNVLLATDSTFPKAHIYYVPLYRDRLLSLDRAEKQEVYVAHAVLFSAPVTPFAAKLLCNCPKQLLRLDPCVGQASRQLTPC
jgi:hypothetical protein